MAQGRWETEWLHHTSFFHLHFLYFSNPPPPKKKKRGNYKATTNILLSGVIKLHWKQNKLADKSKNATNRMKLQIILFRFHLIYILIFNKESEDKWIFSAGSLQTV